jgi:hypothetical protein
MDNKEFKLRLLRTMIKVDSLEKELTGLKNQIADPILDMKAKDTRLRCEKLRLQFEKFFGQKMIIEIGEYYDQADEIIDESIDKFIKEN